jgi:hypothetical protein
VDLVTHELIEKYQAKVFHINPGNHISNAQEAIDFVNQRGFILFWPDPKFELPNLWHAVAGKRPVPDEHNDPAHVTWDWKDSLLDKKVWYYARIIRQRNTMISLSLLPHFYALSPNYGSPVDDIQDQYLQGIIPQEAKQIFEKILEKGPLDTISLRKEAHLSSSAATVSFQRALKLLQRDFKVLPVGIAEAGAWRYAFRYELTHRYFPNLIDAAHDISEIEARSKLIKSYLDSVGAATTKKINQVFGWPLQLVDRLMEKNPSEYWHTCEIITLKEQMRGYRSSALA